MEELSVEEKAKAYDNLIERLKDFRFEYRFSAFGDTIEDRFPELKKSEDEKMRKTLIAYFKKFSEIDSIEPSEINPKRAIAWLEKQGEQKPTNRIEAKFKVGDWIVFNGLTLLVNEVVQGYYRTISIDGTHNSYEWDFDNVARLWTIQDAKDGDVIVCKGDFKYSNGIKYERICLFKSLDSAFFTLTKTSNNIEEYCIDANVDYPDNAVPATKGQKEILFMAMKDAGYKWDSEKKELKKIEQKSVDQKQWKPTGSQLASLEIACDRNDRIGFDLTQLLKELKKLV